jgi:opacity protein-like surface antigen
MKKLFFTALTLCIPYFMQAQVTAAAQSVLPVKLDLGLKVGANFAQLNGGTWSEAYQPGLMGGAFFGITRNKVGGQIEALFSQTKYSVESKLPYAVTKPGLLNPTTAAMSGDVNVSYLTIPVLFQYKVLPFTWLQLGPQFSGVVSVNDKDELFNDAKELFKSDFAGVAGIQVKLPVKLVFSGRYILGFTDNNNSGVGGAWKNRTIQLGVGYSFL